MPTVLCKLSGGGNVVLRPQSRPRWYPPASVDAALVEIWEHDEDEPRSAARLVGVFRPGDKGSIPFNPQTDRNKILYTLARSASGTPDVSSLADAVSATVIVNRDTEPPAIEQIGEATKDVVTLKIPVTRLTRKRQIEIYDSATMNTLLQTVERDAGEGTLPEVEDILREVEVPTRKNFAAAANGATATATQTHDGFDPANLINGQRRGHPWGGAGGGWQAGTAQPVTIQFGGPKTVDELNVITLQDNYSNPIEPTLDMTFTLYGATGYTNELLVNNVWEQVLNVTGNNKVWRQFPITPRTATAMRVTVTASPNGNAHLTELEAVGNEGGALPQTIHVRTRQSGGGAYGAWSVIKELMFASESAPGSSGGAELITRGKINLNDEPIV